MSFYSRSVLYLAVTCLAIATASASDSSDGVWVDGLHEAINEGELFTGKVLRDDGATLGFNALALTETDLHLSRKDEDTILKVGITISFQSIFVKNLEISGLGTHSYGIHSNCDMTMKNGGVRAELELVYDSNMMKFEKPHNDVTYYCKNDRDAVPLYLKINKSEKKKKAGFFGKLIRGAAQGIVNLGLAIDKKLKNPLMDRGKDLLMNLMVKEVNREVRNPWMKDTIKGLTQKGKFRAGDDGLRYDIWQVLQQRKNIEVLTADSKLKEIGSTRSTGAKATLFQPVVTVEDLAFEEMIFKLKSYYYASRRGAHKVMFDFNGFSAKLDHGFLPDFIGDRIMGAVALNDERVVTRKSINDPWKCAKENGGVINQWATSKVLNMILPSKHVGAVEGAYHKVKSWGSKAWNWLTTL
jgi:hypothetical protein